MSWQPTPDASLRQIRFADYPPQHPVAATGKRAAKYPRRRQHVAMSSRPHQARGSVISA